MARPDPTSRGGVGHASRPPGRGPAATLTVLALLALAATFLWDHHLERQARITREQELARALEAQSRALRAEVGRRVEEAVRRSRNEVDAAASEMRSRYRELRERTVLPIVRLEEEARAMGERLLRVDRRSDRSAQDIGMLEEEVLVLGGQVRHNRPAEIRFKEIQKEHEDSVFFVYSEIGLVDRHGMTESTIATYGTGFVVSEDGHIVTSKHVAQPWKFRDFAREIARKGLAVDPDSYLLAAWRSGTRIVDHTEQMQLDRGFNNRRLGNLELFRTAPDHIETEVIRNLSGDEVEVRYHDPNDNHDLVLLKATGGHFRPVTLAAAGQPEKLDPVMVLGFPRGLDILEKGVAESSPSLGTVRKVEETIYVTASIIPGNSGGPIFDADGEVIGIAARVIQGTETLGIGLKVRHIHDLLENGQAPKLTLTQVVR